MTKNPLLTTSLALAATLLLLTPSAAASADGQAAAPGYDVRAVDVQKLQRLAAYCDTSNQWTEVWLVRQTSEVGYYDNDGEWNRDAAVYDHEAVATYVNGSCTGPSVELTA